MDQFKIDNFQNSHPNDRFPAFRTLAIEETRIIRVRLAKLLSLPSSKPPLDLVTALDRLQIELNGFDSTADDFSVGNCLETTNCQFPTRILLNWHRFDQVDEMSLEDFIRFFDDIWYGGADDLDVFDVALNCIISFRHYGQIKLFQR